jgi:hypothetical protein
VQTTRCRRARAINTEPRVSCNQQRAGALALCQSKSAVCGIKKATKQAEFQGGIKALTRENIALSELYGD